MHHDVDPNVVLPAVFVAIPATIAAWGAIRNGRALKTTNGKSVGEYAEATAYATVDQTERLQAMKSAHAETHELLLSHIDNDTAQFEEIRGIVRTLANQDRKAEGVAADLAAEKEQP